MGSARKRPLDRNDGRTYIVETLLARITWIVGLCPFTHSYLWHQCRSLTKRSLFLFVSLRGTLLYYIDVMMIMKYTTILLPILLPVLLLL
jgi:hypothetical protein